LGQEAGNTSDAIADDRRDADGDGLPDGWETAGETPADTQLVDASPEKKDLFVHVVRTEGIDPLTEAEREELRRVWAEMPVDNPSGETGIQIHITGTKIDDRVMSSGSEGDFERLQESYFTELSPTNCVYHTVFLTDIDSYRTAGRAESPGYFAIVDGKRGPGGRWYRVNTITHELLHNIVVIDGDDGHTTSGWLSHSGDRQLSSFTAERLDSGFSHPSSYDGCDVPDFDD
jgi:hypothetical protein